MGASGTPAWKNQLHSACEEGHQQRLVLVVLCQRQNRPSPRCTSLHLSFCLLWLTGWEDRIVMARLVGWLAGWLVGWLAGCLLRGLVAWGIGALLATRLNG